METNIGGKIETQSSAKIVVIGGGTGLSTILKGIKEEFQNITACVTVTDNGGGSGILRTDLDMLPPGDIRNCIVSLSEAEPLIKELMEYRFHKGMYKGQSFGNLFLAAMNGISDNFEKAVLRVSDVLRVKGRVLPVTTDNVNLSCIFEDGKKITGESEIVKYKKKKLMDIKEISLVPENSKPLFEVINAILEADLVVIGPGSLYTSVLPNLLLKEVKEALYNTKAKTVYIMNIMTQLGETEGFSARKHIDILSDYVGYKFIDTCIINKEIIDIPLKVKYLEENSTQIEDDLLDSDTIHIIKENLVDVENGNIRHDAFKIAKILKGLV